MHTCFIAVADCVACFAPVKEEEVCTHVRALHVCARSCVRVRVCVCNTRTCG